ncbi:hypothetical protein [Pseudomonas amygdali]|nr:hypothetical protein [Pseudomonas amygdali]KPC17200.1 Uncharacterized protein AC499_0402 [Pseudomonas amygdali pv. lachrymans]KPC18159.1 Uncharacterized protein AC499_1361 [Pseudomonas amygdali pv. lachrymans]RMT05745.1 hypothetical protein ALP54_03674 [Pseudomonas amygdali pv. lachrymans]
MKRHLIAEKLDFFQAAVKRWAELSKGQKKTIALVTMVCGPLMLLAVYGAQIMLNVKSVIPFPYAWAAQAVFTVVTMTVLELSSKKTTIGRGDK